MNSQELLGSTAPSYVHGYSEREARRLTDQSSTLADLLHDGTRYPAGSRVLEVGCGVGAQTVRLLAHSPGIDLTAVELNADSLATAQARVAAEFPAARVHWRHGDAFAAPAALAEAAFDHVFVCFVLEHLADPAAALRTLRSLLRPGGTITVIEGDHGSTCYFPPSEYAQAAIDVQVRLQALAGGDALFGRRVQPMLSAAGFDQVRVRPRTVYADATRPELVSGFTLNTFTALIDGVRADALASGLSTPSDWDRGIADLRRTAEAGGTFHYTFFKGEATR